MAATQLSRCRHATNFRRPLPLGRAYKRPVKINHHKPPPHLVVPGKVRLPDVIVLDAMAFKKLDRRIYLPRRGLHSGGGTGSKCRASPRHEHHIRDGNCATEGVMVYQADDAQVDGDTGTLEL